MEKKQNDFMFIFIESSKCTVYHCTIFVCPSEHKYASVTDAHKAILTYLVPLCDVSSLLHKLPFWVSCLTSYEMSWTRYSF